MNARRRTAAATTTALGVALATVVLGVSAPTSQARPADGSLYLVQAVPGQEVAVDVDGASVERGLATGDVAGPMTLAPGSHEVVLSGRGWSVTTTVKVGAARTSDVVLHSPASVSGDPVVSQYRVPDQPIGPDKARVLLAHTATAPPADVRVDGATVFRNIANGEYAEADVPAGEHSVALLPTGAQSGAFLGPLDVTLPEQTVSLVYAVGSPRNSSMQVVSHRVDLAADGSVSPSRIETGSSAGLARDLLAAPIPLR